MERKENYWKNIFKDHLSYIKCLPGLETKSTFRLGLFSVGGGKSLMVLWYINIYIFLCEWERKQERSVDHSMERHAINLKISIFIHSSHWCCLPGCSLGLQVFPFWSALSWNEVIEICSEHIKSRWNQTVNICSQQEQLNRALKLDVPSWELICCWDGFLPASLLLWGYCRCKTSLTCWIEPFYQYHFQMLTAVSPVQRHGWLVNKNSPKNPMLNNILTTIWKALGLWHVHHIKKWTVNLLPVNSGEDLLWGQVWVVLFDLFCVRTPRSEMIYGVQISPCRCDTISQGPEYHTDNLPVSQGCFLYP